MGDVVALPLPGATALPDLRGERRALQVTWHEEDAVVVVSTWRQGQCVASVRLSATEAAALVSVLADGLSRCRIDAPPPGGAGRDAGVPPAGGTTSVG
ncbi:hypothetical protein [Actinotalea sp. JY-7885]|uniref:hypothetical protein n=1 Tax=Actinotalea sp. JY-7885 TaxID=2758576 RepID=UPI00165E8B90|nr:hypothetical protein [Actinotalea sp. JY-7885]